MRCFKSVFPGVSRGDGGATAEIGMANAIHLESLNSEFQFVDLGRQVGEFVWRYPHVEVVRLQSAILDLQRQLAGQDR
jgi:hypothetical protein